MSGKYDEETGRRGRGGRREGGKEDQVMQQRVSYSVKNPPANAGDVGSISGSGRAPGKGNGNPLQYSCLGNPMDRGAWWATDPGIAESDTT